MILNAVAKKQFIAKNFLTNCKDGLAGNITEPRSGDLGSRRGGGLGSAHNQNIDAINK